MPQQFEPSRHLADGVVFILSKPETGNCQVDLCEAPAVVDVGSPIAVKGIRSCYRHMSFAMEDVALNIIGMTKRDRRRLVEVMKLRIPESEKGGYEYA